MTWADLSRSKKNLFPEEIENILFEILLPRTKAITVRITYWPPKQFPTNSEWTFCQTRNSEKRVIHSWWLWYKLNQNQNYSGCKSNTFVSATVSNDNKNNLQFCRIFGLTQMIKSPNRITCSSTSLIDHILASLPERIFQESVINVIYCHRKISRNKTGGVHSKKLNSLYLRITRFMVIKMRWEK